MKNTLSSSSETATMPLDTPDKQTATMTRDNRTDVQFKGGAKHE